MTVKNHDILMSEVKNLLGKAAIEAVPFADRQQGFYSTFFLVTKKTGDYRAVVNLRPLNQYLKTLHFKMDTMKTVLNLVKKGDWAFSVDLKDAYFHILIHPSHRKYLRFCIKGKAYQYRVLAFGPKTSPRVFTKVVAVVAAHLRMQSIRLAVYLDDWLALNAIRQMLLRDRKRILELLSQLGFLINSEKSNLEPTQDITYIGGRFWLDKGIVLPTPDRMLKLREVVTNLMGKVVPANIGCNGLLHRANPECKTIALVETCIQRSRGFDSKLSTSIRALDLVVTESQHCKGQIFVSEPYKQGDCHGCIQPGLGRQLGSSNSAGLLVKCKETTSHKLSGIGNSCLDCSKISSSISEPVSADQERQLYRDTVHQSSGGDLVSSVVLQNLGTLAISDQNNINLKGAHISGSLNILPDQLSRIIIRPTEWTLNDSMLHKIFHIWGEPMIDLFASFHNKKMDIFCTWDHHPQALAVDAFSMSWNQMFAYAFPPICLIPKVLQHMRLGQCQVILIAPQWPRRHWYPDLLEMCIANPIKLPLRQDLLRQPKSIIYHPDPKVFSLNAWLLSTDSSKQEVFHKELKVYCQHHGGQVLRKTTLVNSSSSVAGVVKNKLIYIQHL